MLVCNVTKRTAPDTLGKHRSNAACRLQTASDLGPPQALKTCTRSTLALGTAQQRPL